jgi:uncharacterized protein HemY
MNPLIQRLETMLEAGHDNLLLRFGLGKACAEAGLYQQAMTHLEQAIQFDPMHSSSWLWLGRAQHEDGRFVDAQKSLAKALEVAMQKGDKQTEKMARVFLRRAEKVDKSRVSDPD